jgi:hypothetical protein
LLQASTSGGNAGKRGAVFMKRSTLILLAVAIALAALVYFWEIKGGKSRDEKIETSKPAFNINREEIAAITLTRAGQTITIEDRDGKWVITQPVSAPADQSAINSIINSITGAHIERSLAASEEEVKSYGLAEPAVIIEVKLKSGEQHRLRLGNKDFSGLSVYAFLDDSSEVALLPASLLTNADKPLEDLRDRSVLGISQFEMNSLTLSNQHGSIALNKEGSDWKIKSPFESAVDESEFNSLLSQITSAKAEEFVAETASDLAKYGLDKPKITLSARLQDGSERVLTVGSKADGGYYAKSSDRPQIIKIESALYDKLNVKPAELRDKQIIKLNKDELTRIEIKNPNQKILAEKKEDKWLVREPAERKDKELQTFKIFSALETRAKEILDSPSAAIRSKLLKPTVVVQLTDKSGKVTLLAISSADGDDVYVTVKGRPQVYKVGKQVLDDLSFKAADLISQ